MSEPNNISGEIRMSEQAWESVRYEIVNPDPGRTLHEAYSVESLLTGTGGYWPTYRQVEGSVEIDYYETHSHGEDETWVLDSLCMAKDNPEMDILEGENNEGKYQVFIWQKGWQTRWYAPPEKLIDTEKEGAAGAVAERIRNRLPHPDAAAAQGVLEGADRPGEKPRLEEGGILHL